MSEPGSGALFERTQREVKRTLDLAQLALPTVEPSVRVVRVGTVLRAGDGIAIASGLERPRIGELLDVEGVSARVDSIDANGIRLVLLGNPQRVKAGHKVRRTGALLEVPVGDELLGRVVDPLGRPIDGQGPLLPGPRARVEGPGVPLTGRGRVERPLRTGVFAVDTMIPIGRGQRQLVIGDQATGKTELCLDVLAALGSDVIGIYVAIGQRSAQLAARVTWLREQGALGHGLVVAADANAAPGLVHLAPYSACSMAEAFMRRGHDVLVVYDDLTTHAHAHRTLALLLGRPVGREAFPVDVFYAHAKLLERATQLSPALGGGSLTALPVIETQAGDLTAYIPTNLVSITDGQIRLDASLAAAGQTPAVDVRLSVSRVGGKAQPAALKQLAGLVKNSYAQFLELEIFTRLGTRLEASTQQVIDRGRRVREALKQERGVQLRWSETVYRVGLLQTEAMVEVALPRVRVALRRAVNAMRAHDPDAAARLDAGHDLEPPRMERVLRVGVEVLEAEAPGEEAARVHSGA